MVRCRATEKAFVANRVLEAGGFEEKGEDRPQRIGRREKAKVIASQPFLQHPSGRGQDALRLFEEAFLRVGRGHPVPVPRPLVQAIQIGPHVPCGARRSERTSG